MKEKTHGNTVNRIVKIQGMEAVILDMDGVITQTARLHNEAWKRMFNSFLEKHAGGHGNNHNKMTDQDYIRYIDGKPRYEGVKSFLESRNIKMPYGNEDDQPGYKSVCGLGNRKNEIFLSLLKNKGVDLYLNAVRQIKHWRNHGLKTAVVSSSRNCKQVLEAGGISNLFDVRIDGFVAGERGLKGKPNPDIFIEAAKELDTTPGSSVIFEDAISGVQAGSKGDFAFVVGVSRTGNKKELYENGADIVVEDLGELDLFNNPEIEPYFTQVIPSVFSELTKFNSIIGKRKPALFLDYDGTLTPIVKHPEDAIISDQMKDVLMRCASLFTVAIVSGRDLDDLKGIVNIDSLIYAGSHGFRISGPGGLYMEHEKSEEILPELDRIEKELYDIFNKHIEGLQIDRKRYAIGVHYRNVAEDKIKEITGKVKKIIDKHHGFKKGEGKKIVEVKPDVDWDKGKAIDWIMNRLELTGKSGIIPIYIGDDVTDEDAFKSLSGKGIGILVGFHGLPTAAKYSLKNVYQVRVFLQMLLNKDK
jgi:trehalose 6-phosphate phosphatase